MPDSNEHRHTEESNAALSISGAIAMLRVPVPMRAEWRAQLLHEITKLPLPRAETKSSVWWRPIAIRPVYGIAASLLAMFAGAAIVFSAARMSDDKKVATASYRGDSILPSASGVIAKTNLASASRTMIRFALVAPGASRVSIVGDFNGWNPNATPMKFTRDGNSWLVDMPLSAGRHLYAFVVDGDLVADPSAAHVVDDDFGIQNSVVLVGAQ